MTERIYIILQMTKSRATKFQNNIFFDYLIFMFRFLLNSPPSQDKKNEREFQKKNVFVILYHIFVHTLLYVIHIIISTI